MGMKCMSELTSTMEIFSKLSHDLKNDFVVIRALAGSIKKQSPQPDVIDKKIEDINNVLNIASQRLDTVRTLLK